MSVVATEVEAVRGLDEISRSIHANYELGMQGHAQALTPSGRLK